MTKGEQLYEGKAKKVYKTDRDDLVLVYYKDDATALNGLKRGTIALKGEVNNRMSNRLFKMLEKKGIPTHFVEEISARETLVKKVSIVPVEVVMRNVACGSLSKRLGLPEGTPLQKPILEFYYKDDDLGDPMVNRYHIDAMGWATAEEMDTISSMAWHINELLREYFDTLGVDLIDFKLEFGRTPEGIVLADEISPDTCRFWDKKTGERLDKDRFRRDMGGAEDAYQEMMRRVLEAEL